MRFDGKFVEDEITEKKTYENGFNIWRTRNFENGIWDEAKKWYETRNTFSCWHFEHKCYLYIFEMFIGRWQPPEVTDIEDFFFMTHCLWQIWFWLAMVVAMNFGCIDLHFR